MSRNDVAEVTLQMRKPLVLDNHDRIPPLGRFVLVDDHEVSGGGIVFGGVYTDRRQVVSQNITWSEGRSPAPTAPGATATRAPSSGSRA